MMTRFRKRIRTKALQEVYNIIFGRSVETSDDDHDQQGSAGGNCGTLFLDATRAPQNIRFLRDGALLNEASLSAEVESGVNVKMLDGKGYLRVEDILWDALNERTSFQRFIENCRRAYGYYPDLVLENTITTSGEA